MDLFKELARRRIVLYFFGLRQQQVKGERTMIGRVLSYLHPNIERVFCFMIILVLLSSIAPPLSPCSKASTLEQSARSGKSTGGYEVNNDADRDAAKRDQPERSVLSLTDKERAWLDEHPLIRLGYDPDYLPLEFIDKNGKYAGMVADYLALIEQRLDFKFQIVPNIETWFQAISMAKGRQVDAIPLLTQSSERNKYLTFTRPYVNYLRVIITRDDHPFITGLSDLAGKRITALRNQYSMEVLKRDYPYIETVPAESILAALKAVASGTVDAFVNDSITSAYYIRKHSLSNLKYAAPTEFQSPGFSFAIRSDWPVLTTILDKAIATITEEEHLRISQKWVKLSYESKFDYTLLWQLLAAASLLLSTFFYWNRRLAKEVIRRKHAELITATQYRSLFNDALDMIHIVNPDGKIVDANPAELQTMGYGVEEYLGKHLLDIICPEYKEDTAHNLGRAFAGKVIKGYETALLTKNGEHVDIEINAVPQVEDGKVVSVRAISRNISERKKIEQEKKILKDKLLQAQKMEAIGTLAGGITHDFNNILTPILGYSEMALATIPSGSTAASQIQEVLKACNRAKDLVKQILTFCRQTDQNLKPLKIQFVIKEALKLLRASIPTTIEIRENIDPECDAVMGDPTQIHQIIMNLCTNAYHAMREKGGVLAISLSPIELDANTLKNKINIKAGLYVQLEVSDTGHGIDKTILEKIFEPYYTTKANGEGTGLGLSLAHGIVKNLNGEIIVYSEPQLGTTFRVYFPAITDEIEEQTVTDIKTGFPSGNERLLVVDDEEAIAALMQQVLGSLGYKVTAVTSSVEAFRILKAEPENFDLVITDMTMPHMTGQELAKEIFRIKPEMPIILCTGFSELITKEKARKIGISKFITKPISPKDLAKYVRDILDK